MRLPLLGRRSEATVEAPVSTFGGSEARAVGFFGADTAAWPARDGGYSGRPVTPDSAAGIPAVASAIIRTSEVLASLPLLVYSGSGGARQRADQSWQWALLHDRPNEYQSSFDFFFDVSAALEGFGDSCSLKLRSGSRVVALEPLPPQMLSIAVDSSGAKVFRIWTMDGYRELAARDVLHIRGPVIGGGPAGMSPIAIHRTTMSNALAMTDFAGRAYNNNVRPGLVIVPGGRLDPQGAKEAKRTWIEENWGPQASGVAFLSPGSTVQTLPISMEDAQYVEGSRFTNQEIARIFRLPASFLEEGSPGDVSQEISRLTKLSLLPRMRRIERALSADPDLFGLGQLYPEFLADALLRPDTEARYRAYKDARQGSWVTANEIRELENLPPVPGGDEILVTPVGGAPNPAPARSWSNGGTTTTATSTIWGSESSGRGSTRGE